MRSGAPDPPAIRRCARGCRAADARPGGARPHRRSAPGAGRWPARKRVGDPTRIPDVRTSRDRRHRRFRAPASPRRRSEPCRQDRFWSRHSLARVRQRVPVSIPCKNAHVQRAVGTESVAMARRRRWPLRELLRAAARKSDRARRGDVGAAQSRFLARLSVRLPGRHVRFLCHDRQRPAAMDLPHARLAGRRWRPTDDRPAREPAADQGPRRGHAAVLREVAAGEGGVRAVEDPARSDRKNPARQPGPARGGRGDRMHQLRHLLCGLRQRALERRLSRARGAQPRLDAGQRRARRRQCRTPRGGRGGRRLPLLPLAPILPGALPVGAQSDRIDRRAQAAYRALLPRGRDRDMNVRLYVAQRLTAALMVPLVVAHLAVIFYATRPGLTAADVLARTRGSIAWAVFYWVFVAAAATHASIGIRTVLTEWSPLEGRSIDAAAAAFGLLLCLLGVRPGSASGLWALASRRGGVWLVFPPPPLFWGLGLAIDSEARLEGFLRWTD